MSMNPMQKKARLSFLLGVFVTLIIASIIILLLLLKIRSIKQAQAVGYTSVYVVTADILSGDSVQGRVIQKSIENTAVPTNAVTSANFANYIDDTTIAKINLNKGTVITQDMITSSTEQLTNDVRIQEYNMIVLPSQLEQGKFIDVRLRLPNGEDYIVISKKQVKQTSSDSIWINVTEDEILTMSNAIVEAYIMTGSELYATTYVEAGSQEKSTPTYPVSYEVLKLIESDPNIVTTARNELYTRYNASQRNDYLSKSLNEYGESRITNIETKLADAIARQQQARQEYFNSLNNAAIY